MVVTVMVVIDGGDDGGGGAIALPVLSLTASPLSHLQILEYFDYVFTAVFTVEIVLKVSEGCRTDMAGHQVSLGCGSSLCTVTRWGTLLRDGRRRR